MILLLGGTGYVGEAFSRDFARRGWAFRNVSRREADYSRIDVLRKVLREIKPEFLVNCAGYTGKPNVDACETAKADTLSGNALLPLTIAHGCLAEGIPWGHVSSGCIFGGAKLRRQGTWTVEKDLTRPEFRKLLAENPSDVKGFDESDPPNFSFRDGPCSFYSGSKALGEESIVGLGESFIWRLRIPFDVFDNSRNYLSKLQRYSKVYDNANSVSHRADFARACLELWARRAPWGIYNVTNPGWVTTRRVVELIAKRLRPEKQFEFWESDEEFYRVAAKTPRSNCIMDSSKLLATGVAMRSVDEALEDSLRNWKPEVVVR